MFITLLYYNVCKCINGCASTCCMMYACIHVECTADIWEDSSSMSIMWSSPGHSFTSMLQKSTAHFIVYRPSAHAYVCASMCVWNVHVCVHVCVYIHTNVCVSVSVCVCMKTYLGLKGPANVGQWVQVSFFLVTDVPLASEDDPTRSQLGTSGPNAWMDCCLSLVQTGRAHHSNPARLCFRI